MAVNVGSFVGAGTVRAYAKGWPRARATPAELDTMRRVVRDAMLDGAMGLGSALIYPPGSYASTDGADRRSEGDGAVRRRLHHAHALRGRPPRRGGRRSDPIGKEGGVPVEIYHLKAAGVKNWPKAKQVVAKIDSARAAGQDVATDQYPYVAGQNNLSSCIPPWAHADGKLLERLRDPATRAQDQDRDDERAATWRASASRRRRRASRSSASR